MKIPIKSNNSHTRLVDQKKLDEREAWHKLVVKVIRWRDGLSEGGVLTTADKISAKEWGIYSRHTLKTNITYSRLRVLTNLREIREVIKQHGGFEEEAI